ncbi:MAG: hypothetical protein IT539_01795 [Bradyrhizobiaceae bacterium]|nr:hypothetical protein [Bradyrhizobiaceae bacterium]
MAARRIFSTPAAVRCSGVSFAPFPAGPLAATAGGTLPDSLSLGCFPASFTGGFTACLGEDFADDGVDGFCVGFEAVLGAAVDFAVTADFLSFAAFDGGNLPETCFADLAGGAAFADLPDLPPTSAPSALFIFFKSPPFSFSRATALPALLAADFFFASALVFVFELTSISSLAAGRPP